MQSHSLCCHPVGQELCKQGTGARGGTAGGWGQQWKAGLCEQLHHSFAKCGCYNSPLQPHCTVVCLTATQGSTHSPAQHGTSRHGTAQRSTHLQRGDQEVFGHNRHDPEQDRHPGCTATSETGSAGVSIHLGTSAATVAMSAQHRNNNNAALHSLRLHAVRCSRCVAGTHIWRH